MPDKRLPVVLLTWDIELKLNLYKYFGIKVLDLNILLGMPALAPSFLEIVHTGAHDDGF